MCSRWLDEDGREQPPLAHPPIPGVGCDPHVARSKGLRIGKKTYTAESLDKALSTTSVLRVVAPIIHRQGGGNIEGWFNWNGEFSNARGAAMIWFTSGYGEQPFFALEQAGETWHLIEFGVFDFGEP